MGWSKREPVTDLVILGDDEGCIKSIGGLLLKVKQDQAYPQRHNYEVVKKDGSVVTLAGSASLSRQLHPSDEGRFFKATFQGWGKSPNGKFKAIEVAVWEGEPTEDMKKWPKYAEATGAVKAEAPATDEFEGAEEPSDDLPF